MPEHYLALDVGTTTSRAIVMRDDGAVIGRAHAVNAVRTPAPGRIEQDATAMVAGAEALLDEAVAASGLHRRDVRALGITAQRATIVVWDAASGRPVAPLVSWQDLRGVERARALQEQGFLLTHQTPAAKLECVLDDIERGRERLADGKLKWGNIDTFLAWHLSHGTIHAMDETQACTTGYFDFFTSAWNPALLDVQRVAPESMPKLVDTFDGHGEWGSIPLSALIADQQSAALAQACLQAGLGKVSFGTSAAYDVHTGGSLLLAPGAYPMVQWRYAGERGYCVEGMVNTAGAMLDWCANLLGIGDAAALSSLAAAAHDAHGVIVVPALQGLGTPHGNPSATAHIAHLTRATSRADVARATFEAIAFRVREIDDALYSLAELDRPTSLRVDGGAAASDHFMQLQANVLGRPVERLHHLEATAIGAALGAGVGVGAWSMDGSRHKRKIGKTFLPSWSADEREARYAAWRAQVVRLTASG